MRRKLTEEERAEKRRLAQERKEKKLQGQQRRAESRAKKEDKQKMTAEKLEELMRPYEGEIRVIVDCFNIPRVEAFQYLRRSEKTRYCAALCG